MTLPTHKGQAAITDLFIAISIFIILVTVTTLTWELYNIQLNTRLDYDDMVIKSFQISDILVKSKGTPATWETDVNNAKVLGLIEKEKHLSEAKVNAFVQDITYTQSKDLLKINLYDFYFTIKEADGTPIVSKGIVPTGKFNVNLARVIFYQNKPRVMEFSLWK